jgi:hypothetical protein
MKQDLLLGIDVGTTNVKAILATPEGRVVAQVTESYPLLTPRPGWVEQNPADWWQGTASVSRRVMALAEAAPEQVKAIGLSGQGAAAVLVDAAGEPVRPGIIWMDARSEAECGWMRATCGPEILRINGKQPGPYNMDPKLRWLAAHEPESLRKAAYSLTTTGYVTLKLTGEAVLNVSDASIPFAFDQAACDWSDELISCFGIERRLYPRVAACEDVIGGLRAEAAEAMGLRAGTPVIAGGVLRAEPEHPATAAHPGRAGRDGPCHAAQCRGGSRVRRGPERTAGSGRADAQPRVVPDHRGCDESTAHRAERQSRRAAGRCVPGGGGRGADPGRGGSSGAGGSGRACVYTKRGGTRPIRSAVCGVSRVVSGVEGVV